MHCSTSNFVNGIHCMPKKNFFLYRTQRRIKLNNKKKKRMVFRFVFIFSESYSAVNKIKLVKPELETNKTLVDRSLCFLFCSLFSSTDSVVLQCSARNHIDEPRCTSNDSHKITVDYIKVVWLNRRRRWKTLCVFFSFSHNNNKNLIEWVRAVLYCAGQDNNNDAKRA